MELREGQGRRRRATRIVVLDLMEEGLENSGQTNCVSRVSLVAGEGTVLLLEIGDGFG